MKIVLSARSERSFKRLSRVDQIIISKKIRQLKEPLVPQEEKIKGLQRIFRVRVENYRIVYRRSGRGIYIILIAHRKDVYDLLKRLL